MLAVTKNFTYPVIVFYSLFIYNSQAFYALLFSFNNQSFTQQYVIHNL